MAAIDDRIDALARHLHDAYPAAEFPALGAQVTAWRQQRPLAGARVLDATPVFRNTLAKYLALLAAGAELTIAAVPALPGDRAVLQMLTRLGIKVIGDARDAPAVDVCCDCAGLLAHLEPRCGAAELTRSGTTRYARSTGPVVLVDSSRLKRIETSLGTGDGFVRAMRQLGHGDFAARSIAVFGAGKVGSGIAMASRAAGASVTLVDPVPPTSVPPGCVVLDAADRSTIGEVIVRSWCVVSATGAPRALHDQAGELRDSNALLANMGVADEFGAEVPADRVLNSKRPLNFALEEPTRLRYLDPVFALSNSAAVHLVSGEAPPRVAPPPREWEEPILREVLDRGALAPELRAAFPDLL